MDEKTSAFPIINNRYKIKNTIASGGMAVVYRAEDLILGRMVAVKILNNDLSMEDDFRVQFETEAKASAKLAHPNIVTTYDFGIYGERLYIVMELVEGTHLNKLPLSQFSSYTDRLELMKQACLGLAYAHYKGIIHCDIKPQNMLITKEGKLKLSDFGISYSLDSSSVKEIKDEIWGSPYYISPEIAAGNLPSTESDIYSMGIVMYEFFTGELPFQGDGPLILIDQHQTCTPLSPSKKIPDFPKNLEEIILKSLAKKPKLRYHDADALFSALSEIAFNNNSNTNVVLEKHKQENFNQNKTNGDINIEQEIKIDWVTILLSLLAAISIGGLIPFWLIIYYSINR